VEEFKPGFDCLSTLSHLVHLRTPFASHAGALFQQSTITFCGCTKTTGGFDVEQGNAKFYNSWYEPKYVMDWGSLGSMASHLVGEK
jgi:hypothetical protein